MSQTFAFLDEYGNHDLDITKDGASNYFIILAIIVDFENLEQLKVDVEKLRKKYFQTGEIKSSKVGNNHKRRVHILNSIKDLNFKFYTLVVDKDRINRDSGLQYKKSFLKNINGKIFNRLFKQFDEINIVADEHGSNEYKLSFEKYIQKNHKPDLFYRSSFELVQSKNNILVQLADFMVGSIAKIYEKNTSPDLKEIYLLFLKEKKCLGLDEWPTVYQAYYPPDTTTDEFSQLIFSHSLSSADIFIENNESSFDQDIVLQVTVARYLVFYSRMIDQNTYVRTQQIQDHLFEMGYGNVSEIRVRSKIIAKLRDSNVIISSSSKGYKIPCSFHDMEVFVETVNGIIKPLIERLAKARANLNMASKGEIDILKGPKYPHLVSFIETLDK